MGSEVDQPEPTSTPKLPPLIIPLESIPEDQSGHFHTEASIPFLWEEEPGKPIATISSDHTNNGGVPNKSCLDLPPRLQPTESKTTKVPSPTTVLDGPYMGLMKKNIVQGVSFGFKRERHREGSAGYSYSVGSPERGQLGDMVLIGNRGGERKESRGGTLFGSFGRHSSTCVGRKKELGGGGRGIVHSSPMERLADSGGGRSRWEPYRKITRSGSFSSLSEASGSKFWATIYEGFRQVLPWKGRQAKNEGLTT